MAKKKDSEEQKQPAVEQQTAASGEISQAEIDAMLGGGAAPAAEHEHGSSTDALPGVVSQAEIDALMSVYTSVNAEGTDKKEKPVRIYDFSRPDRFSKDRMRALSGIHANFAGILPTVLSSQYQVATRASMISLEQITYKEYLASIPAKTMMALVNAGPLGEEIYVEVSPSIVGAWADCLCGADTRKPSLPSQLTPIDLALVKRVLSTCMQVYADAWADIAQLSPAIGKIFNTEVRDDSSLLQTDAVVVCSIELHVGSSLGMMSICLPATGVENALPSIGAIGRTKNAEAAEKVVKNLRPVGLPCKVVLGHAAVTLEEVASLGIGDVIRTNNRANSNVELWVSGRHMFDCRPGEKDRNIAVVISGAAEENAARIEAAEPERKEQLKMAA